MANTNAPKGFVPVRHLDGSPWNGQLVPFLIPSSDATAVFVGDVIKSNSSSGVAGTVVAGLDCEGIQTAIKVATGVSGQDIVGVVRGFLPDPTNLALNYRAASTNRIALVVPTEDVIFEVQEDAVTTPIAAASIGLNASFNVGSGNTVTGVSTATLISSTVAATATFPVKLYGLSKKVGNAFNTGGASTDQAKFEVVFNTGLFMPNIVGV
jgi:hypothetical protein